jgi:hypothetical protein
VTRAEGGPGSASALGPTVVTDRWLSSSRAILVRLGALGGVTDGRAMDRRRRTPEDSMLLENKTAVIYGAAGAIGGAVFSHLRA